MKARVPPPLWALASALLMWAIHRVVPIARVVPPPWNRLGLVVALAGVALAASAVLLFRRVGTSPNPRVLDKATCLVTTGPYRYTRNPMYTGLLLVLCGIALGLGSLSPFAVPPLFVVLLTHLQIRPEEEVMTRLFGDEYRAYQRRVGRWLKWLG